MNIDESTVFGPMRDENLHIQQMAKIAADKEVALAKQRSDDRSDRRPYVGGTLIGTAVLIFFLVIIWAIWNYNINSDKAELKKQQEITKQVEICTNSGGSWINGNTCVPGPVSK